VVVGRRFVLCIGARHRPNKSIKLTCPVNRPRSLFLALALKSSAVGVLHDPQQDRQSHSRRRSVPICRSLFCVQWHCKFSRRITSQLALCLNPSRRICCQRSRKNAGITSIHKVSRPRARTAFSRVQGSLGRAIRLYCYHLAGQGGANQRLPRRLGAGLTRRSSGPARSKLPVEITRCGRAGRLAWALGLRRGSWSHIQYSQR